MIHKDYIYCLGVIKYFKDDFEAILELRQKFEDKNYK